MLIQLQDGQPIGHPVLEESFRQLFPGTSFPRSLGPADVEPHGFGIFEFSQIPEPADRYDKVVEAAPVRDASGIWRQVWEIVPMTAAERLEADARKAEDLRHERGLFLMRSDHTQLPDAPPAIDRAAWAAYRQALRDLPQQAGFPWQVTWPTPPES